MVTVNKSKCVNCENVGHCENTEGCLEEFDMRTVHRMIPMNLVVPRKYSIEILLEGDISTLHIVEEYAADTPESVFGPTVSLVSALLPKAKVERMGTTKAILLSMSGTENEIISFMINEFTAIREDPVYPLIAPRLVGGPEV